MAKPLVSIIVPVYNAGKTIEKCMVSLFSQTLKEIEVIAVNDCSKDNSLDILKEYKKKYNNLVIINNKENMGPAASRNKALEIAKGTYIGFVDSDDFVEKNMYEVMSSYMNNDVDLITCSRDRDYGNKVKKIINKQMTDNPKDLSLISNYVTDKLFKRNIIDKYEIRFPEKYRYAEDVYFLSVYRCYCNKMKILQDLLYHISFNPKSVTNSYNENILKIIEVLKDIKSFFEKNSFYDELKDEFVKICCQYYSRRVYEFHEFENFDLKKKFIRDFLLFFKDNFSESEYKKYVKKYWNREKRRFFFVKYILSNYSLLISYVKCQDIYVGFKKSCGGKK